MEVAEVIERSRAAAEADPGWLGSDEHLRLIQEFVSPRAPGLKVAWLEGARAFSEAGVAKLPPPTLVTGHDPHVVTALFALHEIQHSEYTDPSGRPSFDEARAALLTRHGKYEYELCEQFFQWLEDGRMQVREHLAHPENDEYVRENYALSVGALAEDYESHIHEEPWIVTPAYPIAQLRLAVADRILSGPNNRALAPAVAEVMEAAEPIIQRAVQSETAAGARNAALELSALVRKRWQTLSRPA